ncbi:AsmA family protein [Shewanella sp. D64]|uniref:AsmA family protein n=1 Tax=unclassified Shewanella TaxID=196818 RepID=UPI0022BA62F5|nr:MULTISPECIES: AsmA family protein [unclassified Shewanella]MEC4725310.1 AsmA family protein [Shewanella sp. D64]MEC4735844.1 AsmA family protein [Shewanella sp. E94]WBJ93185.1 AsmA family protein [Shewanella sp. MTB7]
MKILKWFFIILLLLFASLTAYLMLFFNPNDFKPELVEAVKDKTGRDLVIGDDLSWTFFPSIGIELSNISLSNPQGFAEASMIKVNKVVAEVALMPLFSKQVEIAQLNLDGLTLNLETRKDGQTSFDGLDGGASKPETTKDPASTEKVKLSGLDIGGLAITNTTVRMLDDMAGTEQVFILEKLTLGKFSLGKYAPLAYQLNAELPDMKLTSQGEGMIKIAPSMQSIELKDLKITNSVMGEAIPNKKLDSQLLAQINVLLDKKQLQVTLNELVVADINGSGEVIVAYGAKVPNIDGKLSLGDIDLDAFMPAKTAAEEKVEPAAKASSNKEPDLSALKLVNFNLELTVKSIKVANMHTSNWLMKTKLKSGILSMTELNADLYQGKLSASAQLDGRQNVPSYRFDESVKGVQIHDLMKDAADIDLLAGTASFSVKGQGRSLITENLKKNLAAKGQFEIADGALYGVNIPQMLRDAKAKLSGDLSSTAKSEQKTDFTSLTGSFSVVNGVASNPDLLMASPLIRLAGAGTANIITEALDYSLTTSVVGSLEGQGGGERDALHGIEIPFSITGTFADPKFALDTGALFDAKLKQETEKVKDKVKDSILKRLGGF